MIDLTIPVMVCSFGLPVIQVYRTIKKGKTRHKNIRLILDIFFSEVTVAYDGIMWLKAKYGQKQSKS